MQAFVTSHMVSKVNVFEERRDKIMQCVIFGPPLNMVATSLNVWAATFQERIIAASSEVYSCTNKYTMWDEKTKKSVTVHVTLDLHYVFISATALHCYFVTRWIDTYESQATLENSMSLSRVYSWYAPLTVWMRLHWRTSHANTSSSVAYNQPTDWASERAILCSHFNANAFENLNRRQVNDAFIHDVYNFLARKKLQSALF